MGVTAADVIRHLPPPVVRMALACGGNAMSTIAERLSAAVLMTDVVGFTRLAERLGVQGPADTEALVRQLNSYFSQLIECIAFHGGEVISFAGDALLAIWTDHGQGLADCVAKAAACGAESQRLLSAQPEGISQRVTIAAGEVLAALVGGVDSEWQFTLFGKAIEELAEAEGACATGEVALSAQAARLLAAALPVVVGSDGLTLVRPDAALEPAGAPPAPALEEKAADTLARYLSPALVAGLAIPHWIGESRRISVLFANMPRIGSEDSTALLNELVGRVQQVLRRCGGAIHKLSVDDKGISLIAAMGLPGMSHEHDALRAVRAALSIHTELENANAPTAIGVTTGRAFCGLIGNGRRAEYTIIGDVVNLASRLMQAAGAGVLCDATTAAACDSHLSFDTMPPVRVKGKAESVDVYRPAQAVSVPNRNAIALIGRERERDKLREALDSVAQPGENGAVLLIEGEPGIGKSVLIATLKEDALRKGIAVYCGAGDPMESTTPYYPWRPIFAGLLSIDEVQDPARRQDLVTEFLADEPMKPLLSALLPFDLPENDITRGMTGQVRADNTRELLLRILAEQLSKTPMVLILEDAHWFDSASWSVLLAAARMGCRRLMAITARPVGKPEMEALREAATPISLMPLSASETAALVAGHLRLDALPEDLACMIAEHSGGNPLFSLGLAEAIQQAKLVSAAGGRNRIARGASGLNGLALPDSVHGLAVSRIDALEATKQLTIKTASVIGSVFPDRAIRDIYPLPEHDSHLEDDLEDLQAQHFTSRIDGPEAAWTFRHVVTRDAAYSLLLPAQRRSLHQALAEWYEASYSDTLELYLYVIAHHWSAAMDGEASASMAASAAAACARAGEKAVHDGAFAEAVELLGRALAYAQRLHSLSKPVERQHQAYWTRLLGMAYLGHGDMAAARLHLEESLVLRGRPMPNGNAGLVRALFKAVLQQALHRFFPQRWLHRPTAASEELLETARAYQILAEIYFFVNDTPRSLYSAIAGLNAAEPAGLTAELVRSSGNLCITAGLMKLDKLAQLYAQQADRAAEAIQELPVSAVAAMATAVQAIGIGRWLDAEQRIDRALASFERLGDHRYWEACAVVKLMICAHHHGDFAASAEWAERVNASALKGGNLQGESWGMLGLAENAIRTGNWQSAERYLNAAATLINAGVGRTEEIRMQALAALAALRQGDNARAEELASGALSLITSASPTTYYSLEAYGAVAEVMIALEAQPGQSRVQDLARNAARACKALRTFAFVFPIARPRALLCDGWHLWYRGKRNAADRCWRKALAAAEELAMPYEQALICAALAATGLDSSLAQRAMAATERVGAVYLSELGRQQ